jgi:hypothetical protein
MHTMQLYGWILRVVVLFINIATHIVLSLDKWRVLLRWRCVVPQLPVDCTATIEGTMLVMSPSSPFHSCNSNIFIQHSQSYTERETLHGEVRGITHTHTYIHTHTYTHTHVLCLFYHSVPISNLMWVNSPNENDAKYESSSPDMTISEIAPNRLYADHGDSWR